MLFIEKYSAINFIVTESELHYSIFHKKCESIKLKKKVFYHTTAVGFALLPFGGNTTTSSVLNLWSLLFPVASSKFPIGTTKRVPSSAEIVKIYN